MQPWKDNVYTLIKFDNSNETLPSTSLLLLSARFVTQFSVIKFYNGDYNPHNKPYVYVFLPEKFSSNEGCQSKLQDCVNQC